MCHQMFAQDYINYLKGKTKHFDKSKEGPNNETNPVVQTKQEIDIVKKYKD